MKMVRRERQEMIRKMQKMVKNQISKVWQEEVDDEGGKAEAGDDKEDAKDGEEPDI